MRVCWLLLCVVLFGSVQAQDGLRSTDPDYATRMIEATYKIFNKASTATGFFVQPPPVEGQPAAPRKVILVTADHVLNKATGETVLVVLREKQADGSYKRKDWPVTIRKGEVVLWSKHPDLDIAVLAVELPENSEVKPLPYECLASAETIEKINFHAASKLSVLGFPTRFEVNAAGFPVVRAGSVASHPLIPVSIYKTFVADFSTFAGDSGGPVFIADGRLKEGGEFSNPIILGLVLSQFRHDEKINMLYEERTIHYPLALGTIVYAQYIRDAIGLLKR